MSELSLLVSYQKMESTGKLLHNITQLLPPFSLLLAYHNFSVTSCSFHLSTCCLQCVTRGVQEYEEEVTQGLLNHKDATSPCHHRNQNDIHHHPKHAPVLGKRSHLWAKIRSKTWRKSRVFPLIFHSWKFNLCPVLPLFLLPSDI